MTESEFHEGITNLKSAFMGRIPKDFESAERLWYLELKWASRIAFNRAIHELVRGERWPVLGQVLAATNEHTPKNEDGWLMNKKFCYREIESEKMRCGCDNCHPEFWCKIDNCEYPVAARMKPIAGVPRTTEFCFQHVE